MSVMEVRWHWKSLVGLGLAASLLVACSSAPIGPGSLESTNIPSTGPKPTPSPTPEMSHGIASQTETVSRLPSSVAETTETEQVYSATFAGSWYPDSAEELASWVDEMLNQATRLDGHPVSLVVPHAGYVYSGQVAAAGFKQMEDGDFDVAIIIGADHQSPLSQPISVWAEGSFETPLGTVPVDEALARAIVAADERIRGDPAAFEQEHPIEVELPFLQRVCPDCKIVPILMGADDQETVSALAEALQSTLPGHRFVVIASSDLSHYPAKDDALEVDGTTLGAIETFQPDQVRTTIDQLMAEGYANLATCACGQGPILAAMQVAREMGANTATILRYANSSDSEFGDELQVVGYGAVMFWEYTPPDLTPAHQQELLNLARSSVSEYLTTGQIPEYQTTDPVLSRHSGVFVTLKEGDELRGCIGHTQADIPLYQAVQEMAVAAATSDPRFLPLTERDLDDIDIEISVLSPFQRVADTQLIEVGRDGLMIFKYGHQGILLPQVPVEQEWSQVQFLDNLCLKGGLTAGCWAEGAVLYSFTAQVFSESTTNRE